MPNLGDFNIIHNKNSSDFTIVPLKTDFDVRYKMAREMLLQWTRLQNIPVNDEGRKVERVQCKNTFLALLSDPLQVNVESLLIGTAKRESVLKLVGIMYGDDAVEAIKRERVGN